MPEINREARRALLAPLRRRRRAGERKAIAVALERLNALARGVGLLSQLRDLVPPPSLGLHVDFSKDPVVARKEVDFARALYESRSISRQEYVFFAVMPVEQLHDRRCWEGYYGPELGAINQAIDALKVQAGLGPDDDWKIVNAPPEYLQLSSQWDVVFDANFLKTLREFGLEDLAVLKEAKPEEFNRLRERGRRSVYHRDELAPAIRDIVIRYEEDARKAASVNAYSAAVTSLGAGVEGLLLLRCLHSRHKAVRVAQGLAKKLRPRRPEEFITWTFENLIEVCLRAGWLPPVSTSIAKFNTAGLAHMLRLMRNHVHPGKRAKERPWVETDERDYKDAEAIYVVLLSALGNFGQRKKSG